MKKDIQAVSTLLMKLISGMCYESCAILLKHPDEHTPFHQLIIRPHASEFRIVCGRGGRQIKALQHLGQLGGIQVLLEESRIGDRDLQHPFQPDPAFDPASALALLADLTATFLDKPLKWRTTRALDKLLIHHERPLSPDEADTVDAFSDCLWPWGFRHGALIDLKVKHPAREPQPA